MKYARMIMEAEAIDLLGHDAIDYNLSESSVRDRSLRSFGLSLDDLDLPYGHHYGHPVLRALIAEQSGAPLRADDVIVTAGAAGALFLAATCLLDKGDHVVVAFPNYATNFETPYAIGAEVELHELSFDDGFRLDVDRLVARIRPETRYVSLTCPHNPSGVMFSESDLRRVIAAVEEKGSYLLLDETYRDLAYGTPLPVGATLSDRVISVSSMSKTYGVPGIRIGWLACRDRAFMDHVIAAKEQILITGSVIGEEIACRILARKDGLMPQIRAEVRAGYDVLRAWTEAEPRIEWVRPDGGVTCFARVGATDEQMRRFYDALKNRYRTYIAPGYWFKMPMNTMRLGFGWTAPEATRAGLARVSQALADLG